VCYGERLDASQDGKSQRAWITHVYEETPIAGFKTKFVDVADQEDFAELLESQPVFTICLHRRNLVKERHLKHQCIPVARSTRRLEPN
jgi:hypothetical protein